MSLRNSPTTVTQLVLELQNILSVQSWPVVARSLRRDPVVWNALQDAAFLKRALDTQSASVDAWTPGALALQSLGVPPDLSPFRSDPMRPLEGALGQQARRLDENPAGVPDPGREISSSVAALRRAGLMALRLREMYRAQQDWEDVLGELPESPDELWHTAVACLLNFIPHPESLTSALFSPPCLQSRLRLGVHALTANPINDPTALARIKPAAERMGGRARLDLLGILHALRKPWAAEIAAHLLPNASDHPGDICAQQLQIIDQAVYRANLHQYVGEIGASLEQWKTARTNAQLFRTHLAEELASTAERARDWQVTTSEWGRAVEHAERPEAYQARLALSFLEAGQLEGAHEALAEASDHPAILYARARLRLSEEDPDLHEVRDLLRRALASADWPARDTGPFSPSHWWRSVTDALMETNLLHEAVQTAENAVRAQPDDPAALATWSVALRGVGETERAVEAMHLAVFLDPEDVPRYRQLADTLEAAGLWSNALDVRTGLLEKVDSPTAEDLRTLANCALYAGELKLARDLADQALQAGPKDGLTHALLGQILSAEGERELAREHFQLATRHAPHRADAWLAMARDYEQQGEEARQLETLRAAAHAVSDSADIHQALGKTYLRSGATSQAVSALEQASRLNPNSPDIAYQLGKALHSLGKTEAARHTLEPAYQIAPYHLPLAHQYARVLLEIGEPAHALSALAAVVQAEPDESGPYLDYGRALLATGEDPAEAVEILRRALHYEPDLLTARAYLAEALGQAGQLEDSVQQYQELQDSSLADSPEWQLRLAIGLGATAVQLDRPEIALATLQEAVASGNESTALYRTLAEAYLLAGLSDQAISTAREALRLGPDELETLTWFAEKAVSLQAQSEALTALQRAVELAPERTDLLALMGATQLRLDDHQGAWETYRNIITAGRPAVEDLASAARGLGQLGDDKGRITAWQRAVELSPHPDRELMVELATAQEESGDLEAAIVTLDRALNAGSDDPGLQMRKVRLLLELKRHQAAIACLQHAINLAPDDPQIRSQATEMLRSTGDVYGALEQAEAWMQCEPESVEARYSAAKLARASLQSSYARRILQDGWPQFPDLSTDSEGKSEFANRALDCYCLFAELQLEEGGFEEAAEAVTLAMRIRPEDPRVQAIQARLTAGRGDRGAAADLLSPVTAAWGLALPAGPEDTILFDELEVDEDTLLSVMETARAIGQWEIALQLGEAVTRRFPDEPYPHLCIARTLVARAEWARLCQAVRIVRHAPSVSSRSEAAYQSFERAMSKVNAFSDKTRPASIGRLWQARGAVAFRPSPGAAQALGALSSQSEDLAACVAAWGDIGRIERVRQLSQEAPNLPGVQKQVAIALMETHPAEGLMFAQRAAEGRPDDPVSAALVALIANRLNDWPLAERSLDEALAIWPDEPRWHTLAAEIHLSKANAEEDASIRAQAIRHLETAVRLEPEIPDHLYRLGVAYLRQGMTEESIETLEKAVALAPEDLPGWITLSRAHLDRGAVEAALRCIEQARKLDPQATEPVLLHAEIALHAGDPSEAVESLHEVLRRDSDNAQALYFLAQALDQLNRPLEGLKAVEKALVHADEPLPVLLTRVQLLHRAHGEEAALQAADELMTGYAKEPRVLALKSRLLARAGQSQEAIRTALLALKADEEALPPSERAFLHLTIGRLSRLNGQLDQAIHHLNEAIRLDGHSVYAHLELSRAHLDRREFDRALQVLERAIGVAPEDPRPYYHAGLTLKDCKDYERAEHMLRKAAELAPDDLSVHRQLGAVVALNIVHNNREMAVDP